MCGIAGIVVLREGARLGLIPFHEGTFALASFGLLSFWRIPPWLVVAFAAAGGSAIATLR